MEEEEQDIQEIDFQLEEELIKRRMDEMKMFLNSMRHQRLEREERDKAKIEEGDSQEGNMEENNSEGIALDTHEEASPFRCEELERDDGEIDRKLKELSIGLRGDEEINRILAKITPMNSN